MQINVLPMYLKAGTRLILDKSKYNNFTTEDLEAFKSAQEYTSNLSLSPLAHKE